MSGSHRPFDLCHHTRLRSLQIELGSNLHDATLVTQILSQIPSAHVNEVGLQINTGVDDQIRQLRWNVIDDALQDPSFSCLGTVNIWVVQWPYLYEWDAYLDSYDVPWIADHMPQCNAWGILHIHKAVWESSYFLP
jgi:hypothetical protein